MARVSALNKFIRRGSADLLTLSSVASTLPLWNDKKNVTITYSHIPGEPATTFDDLVQYNKRTDSPGKKPSQVVGIDKKEGSEGARWKWSVRT